MSDQEFESYIALVGKLLRLNRRQRDQIAGELQDHLQTRLGELQKEGVPKQEAIKQALEEFGDAAAMANNFYTVFQHNKRRWMMRFFTFSILGCFVAVVLMMALWPAGARFGTPGSATAQNPEANPTDVSQAVEPNELIQVARQFSHTTELTLATEQALKKKFDFNYDQVLFSNVKKDLEARTGLKLLLHQSATEDYLTMDEPITFNLQDEPLNHALMLMLESKNASYLIDEGVVVIVSKDEIDESKYLRMKMYDCRQLLLALPAGREPQLVSFNGSLRGFGGSLRTAQFGGGAGLTDAAKKTIDVSALLDKKLEQIFNALKAQSESADEDYLSHIDSHVLVTAIRQSVDHDSWESSGSGNAGISVINGVLLVRQSEKNHLEIERLITDLEAFFTRE